MARLLALLCAACALLPPAPALGARQRVVLAFENRSSNRAAVELVAASFSGILARKGYDAIDSVEVSDFLEAMKVSRLDPLPPGIANKLLLRFRADAVLTVVINYVLEARSRPHGPRASPAIGLSARFIDASDRVLWRNSLGLIADELARAQTRDVRLGPVGMTISKGSEQLLFSLPRSRQARAEEEVVDDKSALQRTSPAARRGGPRFPLLGPGSRTQRDASKERPPRKQP